MNRNPQVVRDYELGKQREKDAREIEKYCAEHPGDSLYAASMAILRKRRLASEPSTSEGAAANDGKRARRRAIAKAKKTKINDEIEAAVEADEERRSIQAEGAV